MNETLKHADVTDKILHAFYKKVYPKLGYGFLEKVYENAMALELRRMGLKVEQQAGIEVYYDGVIVGEYFADLLVEGVVIVELKAIQRLTATDEAQLLNYLRATPYEVGLLLNFGPRPDFCRKAYDNTNKPSITWIP
ncbi:MAG: GxxExxY protein [Chloroflexi bacterium]|nr:GxxExxY protein [Chloroflexota bacterium]